MDEWRLHKEWSSRLHQFSALPSGAWYTALSLASALLFSSRRISETTVKSNISQVILTIMKRQSIIETMKVTSQLPFGSSRDWNLSLSPSTLSKFSLQYSTSVYKKVQSVCMNVPLNQSEWLTVIFYDMLCSDKRLYNVCKGQRRFIVVPWAASCQTQTCWSN